MGIVTVSDARYARIWRERSLGMIGEASVAPFPPSQGANTDEWERLFLTVWHRLPF